jgi:hypothetical protein
MHFRIPRLRLDILPLEAFTSRYPEGVVERLGFPEVELCSETLPRTLKVCVLEPAA